MYREPTKCRLRADAGWTLLKRTNTTPEHVVALDKYRDGCEALLPFAEDGAVEVEQRGEVKLPAPVSPPLPSASVSEPPGVPPDVARDWLRQLHAAQGMVSCADGGEHRFNIDTRRCVFCGQTRKQALGRQEELMV